MRDYIGIKILLAICPSSHRGEDFLPQPEVSWNLRQPCELSAEFVFAVLMYLCVVCCDLSIFISNFIDLIFLSCFLMSLANGSSILFIFSKNQLLALLIFAMVSVVSFAFISALNFYNLFPSANPGVLHFFLL